MRYAIHKYFTQGESTCLEVIAFKTRKAMNEFLNNLEEKGDTSWRVSETPEHLGGVYKTGKYVMTQGRWIVFQKGLTKPNS